MAVNESSATALVRFTGLGIICFNQDRQRGEIAAIRDNKHTLTVKIQKPVYQDGADNDIIAYQDIAAYHQLPKDEVRIEIKAAGNPAIEGYEVYRSGDFDRLESADANDFRWIVNLNSLHPETSLAPNGQSKHTLAKIYIGNGLFYTHKLDRHLFFEKVEKDATGSPKQREAFGNVGETIGVKIEGDAVSFTVRIGDAEETHLLQRVEGLPYRIEIKNMAHGADAVFSDMPDYYRYLSSPTGEQFDLSPVLETEGGESISQEEFCHPIGSDDLRTIDDL